jgi:hypothetical protein
MRLSMEQRGAWISLGTVACALHPRGEFESREHAELLLRREGATDPAPLVEALIACHLLDELEDGRLVFHNWDRWQRKPSDMPEARTERSRRHREGRATPRNADATPAQRPIEQNRTEHNKEDKEDTTRRVAPLTSVPPASNLYGALHHVTGRACNRSDQTWVDDLVKMAGDRGTVHRLMLEAPESKRSDNRSLLGWLKHQLGEAAAS